jgi:hypothetical protein
MKKNNSLPSSLQHEINSRDTLKQKLREKINKQKESREQPSLMEIKKLEKDAKKEKKEVDNDPRVTNTMKNLFIIALKMYPGIDLANPVEILNNQDKYKLDYYKFCTDLLKKNNNDVTVLNNPYCNYMKEVLALA